MGRRPRRDPGAVPRLHRKRRAAAGPILARATAWTPLFISPNPSSSCRAPTVRSRSPISSRRRTSRCASGRHRHLISRPAAPGRFSPTRCGCAPMGRRTSSPSRGGGAAGFRAPGQRASPSWAAALVRARLHRFPHRAAAAAAGHRLCRLRGRACRGRARKAPRPLGVPLPEQLAAPVERPRRGRGALAPDGAGDRPQAARPCPRARERPRRLRPEPLRGVPPPGRGAQSGENRGPRPPPRHRRGRIRPPPRHFGRARPWRRAHRGRCAHRRRPDLHRRQPRLLPDRRLRAGFPALQPRHDHPLARDRRLPPARHPRFQPALGRRRLQAAPRRPLPAAGHDREPPLAGDAPAPGLSRRAVPLRLAAPQAGLEADARAPQGARAGEAQADAKGDLPSASG